MSIPPPGYETPEAPPPPPPHAPQGFPLHHEAGESGTGSRQAGDKGKYEFKSVQALRGRESRAKARWQGQGWVLVSEVRGTLRTELYFRRVKPKTFGAHLPAIATALGRMQPKRPSILLGSFALILLAGVLGIVGSTQGGGDATDPTAGKIVASGARPAEPAPEASELDASRSSGPAGEKVLTAGSSEELAALLELPDSCDETIAPFAAEYDGRTIEFDGSIADMANHGDYDTRYDILIAPGDKGPESTVGPAFKFEDVNVFDLNLTGNKIPEFVGKSDRFRFVAQVVEYNPNQCLFFLEPVSTRVR